MLNKYGQNRSIYIWDNKSLCLGSSNSSSSRHYGAATIHIGIFSPFKITINNNVSVISRCAYIPVNTKHHLEIENGVHAKFFIEREHPDYYTFLKQLPVLENEICCFNDENLIEFMQWVYEEEPQKALIDNYLEYLFNFNASDNFDIDKRILKVMDMTLSNIENNYPYEDLASAINVSPSHFLHLFKENMNMPYRRYRLWKRIKKSIQVYYRTESITRAALESGFNDISHFSHSFRETYGVNPNQILKKVSNFEVV